MKKRNFMALAAAFCMVFQSVPSGMLYAEETNDTDFKYGDVNGDGIIDITDLSVLSQHLIKDITLEGKYLKAADTDGDNDVKLGDLAHLKMFVSKYNVTLGPKSDSTLKIKSASGYDEVYSFIDKASQSYYEDYLTDTFINGIPEAEPEVAPTLAATIAPSATMSPTGASTPGAKPASSSVSDRDYSDTYNQEENVLEADIVKTDGNAIYSFLTSYGNYYSGYNVKVKIVYANDGKFEKEQELKIDLSACGFGEVKSVTARNMYLYNDMIIVLGNASISSDSNIRKTYTFVSAYRKGTAEKEPELIDTYYQEGDFNDVRITPDGYMYLISNGGFSSYYRYYPDYFRNEILLDGTSDVPTSAPTPSAAPTSSVDEETVKSMIPQTGTNEGLSPANPENVYIPCDMDDTFSGSYTIIGSINLNSSDSFEKTDAKIITGYTGDIYCSENSLYLTHQRYSYHYIKNEPMEDSSWDATEITRVSLDKGKITPEASAEVPGYVKDQFSMSEYEGCFRIVTTATYYHAVTDDEYGYTYYDTDQSNNAYVFDMNLNKTGEITHFAKDESVKSVSFSGNLGYVVTFVQTDPLFAIDFSDPKNPVILDEYKIDGYSTYMQQWDDEHLLGFGVSTHEKSNGAVVSDGYKLVMFNNSDPENLSEEGIYKLINDDIGTFTAVTGVTEDELYKSDTDTTDINSFDIYLYSGAEYERKELLIAPEKNLIGFPVEYNAYWNTDSDYSKDCGCGYFFFSYDDGEFTMKNFLGDDAQDSHYNYYYRAVYIGDYVYIISSDKLISADIETCTKADEISLKD